MNPGMLLFGLLDSGIAFFLVYYIIKARLGGNQKPLARILASIFGTLVFAVYFAVIVWFNTAPSTVSQETKIVVYLAPIVLSVLITTLVLLSQPPKLNEDTEESEEDENQEEPKEAV